MAGQGTTASYSRAIVLYRDSFNYYSHLNHGVLKRRCGTYYGAHARRSGVVEVIYNEHKLVRCFINNFMSIFVESTKYCQVQDWQAKNGFVYMTIKVAGRWENLTGKEDLSLHRPGAVYEGEYALGK